MTLDEVISYNRLFADMETKSGDLEVAEYYRDTAKCLEELKELREQIAECKRLLKAAVEDINYYVDCYEAHCDECCCDQNNHCHWKHEAEALALLGEDTNVPASADDTNVGHKSGGWISCKDRMPDDNELVLFCYVGESGIKSVHYGYHQTVRGLGSSWGKISGGWRYCNDDVTHWMPIPEPPKDGDTNG